MAIQDAVVAANVLWEPLRRGRVSTRDLVRVQRQRELSMRVIQAMQAFTQRGLLEPAMLASKRAPRIPPVLRIHLHAPGIRGLLPRLVAFGVFRPHVRSADHDALDSSQGGRV